MPLRQRGLYPIGLITEFRPVWERWSATVPSEFQTLGSPKRPRAKSAWISAKFASFLIKFNWIAAGVTLRFKSFGELFHGSRGGKFKGSSPTKVRAIVPLKRPLRLFSRRNRRMPKEFGFRRRTFNANLPSLGLSLNVF